MKLRELAERLGCELLGDGEVEVRGVAGLEQAGPGDLTFLANARYAPQLATTRRLGGDRGARATRRRCRGSSSTNPYLAFARAVALLRPPRAPRARRPPVGAGAPDRRPGGRTSTSAPSPSWARGRGSARARSSTRTSSLYDDVDGRRGLPAALGRAGARGLPARRPRRRAERRGDRRRRLRLREGRRRPVPQVPAGRDRGDRGRRRDRRAHRHRPRRARRDAHRPRHASSTTWCRSATR